MSDLGIAEDLLPEPSFREDEENEVEQSKKLKEVDVPERLFDAFAFLTILKTLSDYSTLVAFTINEFHGATAIAGVGLAVAFVLRFVANNFMKADLASSGIAVTPGSCTALFNSIFGTRFGFRGHYERLRTEFARETVIEAEPVDDPTDNVVIPPPNLYGGTETVNVGPRTLVAMAEVIQQGFVFYPLVVAFLEFGFSEGEIELAEVLFVAGMLNFAHMLCWLVSPLLNVSYGYVYFTTWVSFLSPFLVVLLFSVAFNEVVTDAYYTRREIYAWLRFGIALIFGIIGLAVYNSNMHRMQAPGGHPNAGTPAILYFMQIMSAGIGAFDIVSLVILLINEDVFVFDNEQVLTTNVSRLKSFVLANFICSIWVVNVAFVENISVQTELKNK